jgi:glycolate oxidase iron-sulfur subunit
VSATDRETAQAGAVTQSGAVMRRSAAPEEFQTLHDHVVTCSKCGFCQPVCPIFRATGLEAHVARGKVALYRNMIEDRLEIGPEVKDAFGNCLMCRACTDICFPAIRTDDVVVSFRHAYAERFGRGFLQRRVFRSLLPRPWLMRTIVRAVWRLRRTGVDWLLQHTGVLGMLNPKLERAFELGAGRPGALLTSRLRKKRRAPRDGRPVVGYWISCGYNYVLPEVGESTVRVLERLGYAVEVLNNACCGLAAYGYGDAEAATALARENLERLGDVGRFEAIVSECGSCSGHLKEYAHLLADDPRWSGAAERLRDKVRSFSEFVVERGGVEALAATVPSAGTPGVSGEVVVTYHDPCHLGKRYQNVVEQPREILRSLPGVRLQEMAEADSCCGAAGTYGVLHPETSAAIIERKMGFARDTRASVIVTECPSCMMQLRFGAEKAGLPVSVLNVTQVCDGAIASTETR